jgi:DNA-binding PadR family transcriptional regulator
MARREPSLQTLRVLRTFLETDKPYLSGTDLIQQSNARTGTLYPILLRLESYGWLESFWENIDPSKEGRPRRRYYRLTALGVHEANAALSSSGIEWRPSWAF